MMILRKNVLSCGFVVLVLLGLWHCTSTIPPSTTEQSTAESAKEGAVFDASTKHEALVPEKSREMSERPEKQVIEPRSSKIPISCTGTDCRGWLLSWFWSQISGLKGDAKLYDFDVDSQGDLYVLISHVGDLEAGSFTIKAPFGKNLDYLLLLKITKEKKLKWFRHFRTSRSFPSGGIVKVCGGQSLYFAVGDVGGEVQDFEKNKLNQNINSGAHLLFAKYDLSGKRQWWKLTGGKTISVSIESEGEPGCDKTGNFYFSGRFKRNISLGGKVLNSPSHSCGPDKKLRCWDSLFFVAGLKADGSLYWFKPYPQSKVLAPYITVFPDGGLSVLYEDNTTDDEMFYVHQTIEAGGKDAREESAIYLRFHRSGSNIAFYGRWCGAFTWKGISFVPKQDANTCGSKKRIVEIVGLMSRSGKLLWWRNFELFSGGKELPKEYIFGVLALGVDSKGAIYVWGRYPHALRLAQGTMSIESDERDFLVKMNGDGTFAWSRLISMSIPRSTSLKKIHFDSGDRCYVQISHYLRQEKDLLSIGPYQDIKIPGGMRGGSVLWRLPAPWFKP